MTSFLCIKIKTFAGLISDLKYKIISSINSDLSGFKYIYNTGLTKSVKELADSLPANTLLIHHAWSALSDYPTKNGRAWILEILKGGEYSVPRIILTGGKSMYYGYYHIGVTDAIEWLEVDITKV